MIKMGGLEIEIKRDVFKNLAYWGLFVPQLEIASTIVRLMRGEGKRSENGKYSYLRVIDMKSYLPVIFSTQNPDGKSSEAKLVKEGKIKSEDVIWGYLFGEDQKRRWIFKAIKDLNGYVVQGL